MGDLNAVGAHCPRCGAEYRPGFTVCADDGAELVPGPAPQAPPPPVMAPEPPRPESRWVTVARFATEDRARLLAGRLDAEGIPIRVDPEWTSMHYGAATSAFLGKPIEVLVPEERVVDAVAILREIEAS